MHVADSKLLSDQFNPSFYTKRPTYKIPFFRGIQFGLLVKLYLKNKSFKKALVKAIKTQNHLYPYAEHLKFL